MGVSINLKKLNLETLLNSLQESGAPKDKDLLLKILSEFGIVSGDDYIILHNEHYEDYNAYFEVAEFFDRAYGLDCFYECFCKPSERIDGTNAEEVSEKLGIELAEKED